ncbi:thiamine-phosphate kinase [Ottowia sp. GY511]|nr:thiamine-phosphate kinase [Ottowia sp. GY511]
MARYFKRKTPSALQPPAPSATNSVAIEAPPIALGIGDDCALLTPAPGQQLAISTDMLVKGRHFFPDVDPAALGHKALAVNLSDLAAMGAEPVAFTLALALPPERAADDAWMSAFAQGLFALADEHRCPLIGGDTTAGPLNICITVFGQIPVGQALRRDGAQPGDDIWVSGTLGEARLALLALQGQIELAPERLAVLRERLERPIPRIALGRALRAIATSAMDLSDGLSGDLTHMAVASGVGAVLDSMALGKAVGPVAECVSPRPADPVSLALTGGDDYELLFTASPGQRDTVNALAVASALPLTRIGQIRSGSGLWLDDGAGGQSAIARTGYDHFA